MNDPEWILAVDLGTSTLKVAAIDGAGRLLACISEEYELDFHQAGHLELKPDLHWELLRLLVNRLLGESPVPPASCAAIAFCSQGHTFVLRDGRGRPLHPFVTWLDQRAGEEAKALTRALGRQNVYDHTGYVHFLTATPAAVLLWMRRHHPHVFRSCRWFLLCQDDMVRRLCGATCTERVLAGTTGLYDLRNDRWWPEACDAVGLRPEVLPPVRRAGEVVGGLMRKPAEQLGLRPGLPIILGTNDQLSGAVGAANLEEGSMSETTGTALAMVTTVREPIAGLHLGIPWWGHPLPDRYVAMPLMPTAAAVLKWFRSTFAPEMDYSELTQQAANVPPGSEGLICLPHFSGTGTPDFQDEARGCFCGIQLFHTRAHFVRAIMEGVCCALRWMVELCGELVPVSGALKSLGGAARSDLWLQMKADVLNRQVQRIHTPEAALLGAAVLGSVGLGWFKELSEAASAMVRIEKTFNPQPGVSQRYEEVYTRYRAAHREAYSN